MGHVANKIDEVLALGSVGAGYFVKSTKDLEDLLPRIHAASHIFQSIEAFEREESGPTVQLNLDVSLLGLEGEDAPMNQSIEANASIVKEKIARAKQSENPFEYKVWFDLAEVENANP